MFPLIRSLLVTSCFLPTQAHAITIQLDRIEDGELFGNSWGSADDAPSLFGTGTLDSIAQASAQYWSNIILDPATVTFQYGWQDNASSSNLGAASRGNSNAIAYIRFNSNFGGNWFADGSLLNTATPHEEFTSLQQSYQDLAYATSGTLNMEIGHRINAQAGSLGAGRADIFSTMIHEMGHALGLSSGNSSFISQIDVTDPAIDANEGIYTIGAGYGDYTGLEINVDGGHLRRESYFAGYGYGQPMMAGSSGVSGQRRLATELDVLAVAAAAGYTNLNFDAATSSILVPEASITLFTILSLSSLLVQRRRHRFASLFLKS